MEKNLEQMKVNFEKAVNDYVAAFLELFDLDEHDCWWVCDEVGRNLFCFYDSAISLSDMIFCIHNNVSYDEFVEHEEYCIKCHEYNLPTMNIESWHKGCPCIPQSTFDKLDGLKKYLDDAIKNEKQKY